MANTTPTRNRSSAPPRRSNAIRRPTRTVQTAPEKEKKSFLDIVKSKPFIIVSVIVLALGIWGYNASRPSEDDTLTDVTASETQKPKSINGGTDSGLAQMQDNLIKQKGKPPEGFVWGRDKKLWSLGDPNMNEDDAVTGYLRALQLLDIQQAQFLSHDSKVLETYESLNANKSKVTDVEYQREAFVAGMQSIEVTSIQSSAGQADNKKTYNIDISIVDFSDTSFVDTKKAEWFETMYRKDVLEGNNASAEQYIQTELTRHYSSPEAKKKSEKISLGVEKLKEINSGWLVRGDTSLNDKLKSSSSKSGYQGTLKHIKDEYGAYKKERTAKEQKEKRDAEKAADQASKAAEQPKPEGGK